MKSSKPDRRRFEELMLPHLDSVYRVAVRLSGNAHVADELVQETYLRAYSAFDRYELKSFGPKPWLLKILHNVHFTRLGRDARQPKLLGDADFDVPAAADQAGGGGDMAIDQIDWEQFDEEIKEAIDELSPDYQVVLLLWTFEGLSYKEIAEVCGIAIGTVMSRLFRARQQLSRKLAAYAAGRNMRQTGL